LNHGGGIRGKRTGEGDRRRSARATAVKQGEDGYSSVQEKELDRKAAKREWKDRASSKFWGESEKKKRLAGSGLNPKDERRGGMS